MCTYMCLIIMIGQKSYMCSLASFLYRLLISFSLLKQARNKTSKFIRWSDNPIHTHTHMCYLLHSFATQQKAAVKKLDNIQQDHQRRLQALKHSQVSHKRLVHFTFTNNPERLGVSITQTCNDVHQLRF